MSRPNPHPRRLAADHRVRLLNALRAAGPDGLTRTQVTTVVFRKSLSAAEVDSVIRGLAAAGLAKVVKTRRAHTHYTTADVVFLTPRWEEGR